MPASTGNVTVRSADSTIHTVAVTTDSSGLALASSFSSITALFASTAGVYTLGSSDAGYFAAGNGAGSIGLTIDALATGSSFAAVLVGDSSTLNFSGSVATGIVSGDGNDTISVVGAADTIHAGTGSNTISVSGSGGIANVYTVGFDTVTGDSSTAINVDNDAKSGAGSAVAQIFGGSASVEGSGTTIVYGGSGAFVYDTGAGNNVFVANDLKHPAGNAFFIAPDATGNNQFWAGSGNASLIGGLGNDTLVAGTGNATMTGGSGANEFAVFNDGTNSANVTISDFGSSASNYLSFFNFGSSAIAQQATLGTDTVLKLTNGTTITLSNVTNLDPAKVQTYNIPNT